MFSPSSTGGAEAPPAPVRRKRVPAEERREEVLEVALEVVARDGMHGASTAEIAKRAGMSHAYLFRLFPTKEELMVAVAQRSVGLVRREMTAAGDEALASGNDALVAMGGRWMTLLENRTLLQLCLKGISAAEPMPAVGAALRDEWQQLASSIEQHAPQATVDDVREFIATGMLLMVISGLQAGDADWVTRLFGGPLPCTPEELAAKLDISAAGKSGRSASPDPA